MRQVYDFEEELFNEDRSVEGHLRYLLRDHYANIFVDEHLLFLPHHFAVDDWTIYDNGEKKSSTLRYKTDSLRIPANTLLPAYETREFKKGMNPRALVSVKSLVIANPGNFTLDELKKDGFTSHDEMLTSMQRYYPDLNETSIMSLYVFRESIFNPSKETLKEYFSIHPKSN